MARNSIDAVLLTQYETQSGQPLKSLTEGGPVLLVFLRHFG